MYTTGINCSVTGSDYPYTGGNFMDQATELNNGKHICMYGEDSLGNKTTIISPNAINVDITSPTISFTNIVET